MMNAGMLPPHPPGSATDGSYFSPRVRPHGPERSAFPALPPAPLMLSRAGTRHWVTLRFLRNVPPSPRPRTRGRQLQGVASQKLAAAALIAPPLLDIGVIDQRFNQLRPFI